MITQAPEDYIKISSGLGEAAPTSIIVFPVLFEETVMAVIELASFTPFTEIQQNFLDQLSESIGVVLNTIHANTRTEELLLQSQSLTQDLQSQSEELQAQQDELRRSNAELEAQTATLRASEELLQTQQEELQQTNEELEERSQQLEEQNRRIEIKNAEIEEARKALEEKAEQLALSSKYKSEFLANMSHELRTPLNSLLILAKLLGDNVDGNLTDKQIEFANTIHNAGAELLGLINDILDLSKVEAGKMDVQRRRGLGGRGARRRSSARSRRSPRRRASRSSSTSRRTRCPTIVTDQQRLQQVLKNLLSNAFKFTETGGVVLRVAQAPAGRQFAGDTLANAAHVVGFSVEDTGVGIAADKLRLIFEAFQQADGTTSRRYGGTGLGLSISREIARLLGGEIHVESTPGEGSTFTLYLPDRYVEHARGRDRRGPPARRHGRADAGDGRAAAVGRTETAELDDARPDPLLVPSEVSDDRDSIEEGDRVVLIVEDDADFARTELEIARERGFKGIVALRGDTGLALAREFRPDAIVLDMSLPVLDGWTVLDRLKRHPATRHIPVHIVSGVEEMQPALMAGAAAFAPEAGVRGGAAGASSAGSSPSSTATSAGCSSSTTTRRSGKSIVELVGGDGDVEIVAVGSSEEALAALDSEPPFDCMVLDLKLPKMTGFALLEKVKTDERSHSLPVIVYTGKELTRREETKLKRYAETIVVKDARSPERLLDETSLFLHRVESKLPDSKRRMLEQLHNTDALFVGKKVLIVDDDVRNVFALTSALEANGMEVLFAENGREGIEALRVERRRRPRPDGRDDAGDGRLRDDAGDPGAARVREAADHRADGEGDEGRPRALDRRRRLRLHHEAGRHRPASLPDARVALPVERGEELELEQLEIELLLEGIYRRYGFDFREYAPASLKRRLRRRMDGEKVETVSALQNLILHDPAVMERLLLDLSVNVTAMFRDPTFYLAFREKVVPVLRTYPFSRLWVAGCSTGEEVYSLAILLAEEGLADRVRIYATDINEAVIDVARLGVFPLDKMQEYTQNYIRAGGTRSFSEYYVARYDGARFAGVARRRRRLRAAQPRLGRRVQRVPRDHVPQRDDLLRPAAAGARAPALLREPRDVRRARARAEGNDPVLSARELVRGARRRGAAVQEGSMSVRGDRDRRVLGRAAGGGNVAGGNPGRARPGDRDRAAPLGRVDPRRARVAAAAAHRAPGARAASTRSRSSRARSTSLPPTTTCSSTAAASRSPSRAASSSRGRRSTSSSSRSPRPTATARSGSCSPARTRTAPPGSPRSSGTAASGSSRTRGPRRGRPCRRRRSRPSQADAVLPLEEIGPFLYGLCCA